ncbi:DoxX family protein [Brevibacterium antiquum]|uniref:DoxX-like family protein n=1 Tax=Brevibacterium antiquum TaxID=234835 RepID=A0A2H1KQW9_9MICO|nr:DoxX family protein [Brevibacterium antiquum]SMY01924.1 DoxX-like family protein [Brevibacterium antiquum]
MSRTKSVIYWTTTGILAAGLLGSGIQQLLRTEAEGAIAPPYAWGIVQLGYPAYLLTILGIWKIVGAVAILVPKFPIVKEWAYAGIVLLLTGALFSHLAVGHSWVELLPALGLLALAAASWYLRATPRRITKSTRTANVVTNTAS